MSQNPLSAERLAVLRARLVRMQLHAEAADLWPGATPCFRTAGSFAGGEAARAFSQFLQLCRDAGLCVGEEIRLGAEARKAREAREAGEAGKPVEAPWPAFWHAGVRYVLQVLQHTLGELAAQWLIEPAPVRLELSGRGVGYIDQSLKGRGWQSRFHLFAPPEEIGQLDRPRSPEEWHALRQWRESELTASRLGVETAAALARCVRHLDEILTNGKDAGDFDDPTDEGLSEAPLAVEVPPVGPDGSRAGLSVRVLGKPKSVKSVPMMRLIAALVESADGGLAHAQATKYHSNASKVLHALCKKDEDWRRALALPANGRGGYRVRRMSEVPAEKEPDRPTDQMPTKCR